MRIWWQLTRRWFQKNHRLTLLAILLALSTVFTGLGLLSVAGWFLTSAFLAGASLSFNFFTPSALVRILSIARIVSRYLERITGHQVTLNLQTVIRSQSFLNLMALNPAEIAQYKEGDLLARLVHDIEQLDHVFLLIIIPFLCTLITGLVYSAILGQYLPWMAWIALLLIGLSISILPYGLAKHTATLGHQTHLKHSEVRAFAHDAFLAQNDLQQLQATPQIIDRFNQLSLALSQKEHDLSRTQSSAQNIQHFILALLLFLLLVLGIEAVTKDNLSAPIWVALILCTLGFNEVFQPLMRGASLLAQVKAAASRLTLLEGAKTTSQGTFTKQALAKQGTLQLKALSWSFNNQQVLDNITLTIPQGTHLHIQGISGAGKTTLLLAILQIHRQAQGHVFWNTVDLSTVHSSVIYQHIAYLSQHSAVFMGTVADNLRLAQPEADDKTLWQALKDVQMDQEIQTMGGLQAWIDEAGNNLSTGQIRRLCLARILLKKASIWLLDEPTAGLDEATALNWLKQLHHLAKDNTLIMISHDPLAPEFFELNYILEEGQLHPF